MLQIAGLMGMASLTENQNQIREEFRHLKSMFEQLKTALPEDPFKPLAWA